MIFFEDCHRFQINHPLPQVVLTERKTPLKKLTIILGLALLGLTLSPAMSARTSGRSEPVAVQEQGLFTHQEAGVRFQLPKGWKAKPDGEVITASSADDALQVVFWIPDEANFDAAVKEMDIKNAPAALKKAA